MHDDLTGILFIYFDHGHIQELEGACKETDIPIEFCVHMDQNDINKLKEALTHVRQEET